MKVVWAQFPGLCESTEWDLLRTCGNCASFSVLAEVDERGWGSESLLKMSWTAVMLYSVHSTETLTVFYIAEVNSNYKPWTGSGEKRLQSK